MHLLIRKCANLFDVSPDGVNPLDPAIVAALAPLLTYTHRRFLRGAEVYNNPTGQAQHIELETKCMWRLDGGRFTGASGFIPKVKQALLAMGHHVREIDLSPPHHRSRRFECVPTAINHVLEYRARQEECVAAMDAAKHGGIIKAPTGFGKTTLICAMALRYPHAAIHIVVKQVAVATRIMRQLSRFLPNVGMLGGGKRVPGRVMVITADSVHNSNGDADILFGDEAHQLATGNYSEKLAARYRYSRNYGFSATPFARADGASARLEGMFGPLIFEMSYAEAVRLGLVVPIEVHWLGIRMDRNPAAGKKETAKKRWGIWRNRVRNEIIADEVRNFPIDEQTLILVETVEHAVHLWQHLKEYSLCYAEMKDEEFNNYKATGMLPPTFIDVSPKVRYQMQVAFENGSLKKVIATDVWATGVDFTGLQTVVRADARDSEIIDTQGPGRVSRTHAGKTHGRVIDTIDYFDDDFYRKSRSRYTTYKELEWDQDWPEGRRNSANADQMRLL